MDKKLLFIYYKITFVFYFYFRKGFQNKSACCLNVIFFTQQPLSKLGVRTPTNIETARS
jgi:hypothetical protein